MIKCDSVSKAYALIGFDELTQTLIVDKNIATNIECTLRKGHGVPHQGIAPKNHFFDEGSIVHWIDK